MLIHVTHNKYVMLIVRRCQCVNFVRRILETSKLSYTVNDICIYIYILLLKQFYFYFSVHENMSIIKTKQSKNILTK